MIKNQKTILMDVTTLVKWSRVPVGIIRTQLEVTDYLLRNEHTAQYCKFNDNRDTLELLDKKTIEDIVFNLKNFKSNKLKKRSNKIVIKKVGKVTKVLDYMKVHGLKQLLIHICKMKCSKKIKETLKNVYLKTLGISNAQVGYQDEHTLESVIFAPEMYQSKEQEYSFLHEDILFISMGLDWDSSNYPLLYWLKKKYHFKFIGSFYDGIPVTNPELVQSYYFSQMFFSHIYYLLHLSDKIFCISDFSKTQLIEISKSNNLHSIPILKTIHLGDSVFSKKYITLYPERKHNKNYVIYVSTIESRKNHILLLKVWQKLQNENFSDLPDLVLVGMTGWGVDEFNSLYSKDNNLQKKVHLYHDVDDEELISLYKNCRFTVFPSFIEGWGLGAVESMLYEKPCIISNCDALIEATQGLMPAIEPTDIDKWCEFIKDFSKSDKALNYYKQVIANEFKSKEWNTFSQEFIEFAKENI